MAAPKKGGDDEARYLVGIIADEITTIGFLLAGIGQILDNTGMLNFLIVNQDDLIQDVEKYFHNLYNKSNVGLILIGSDIWKYIEPYFNRYLKKQLPIVMNIMTKTSETQPLRLRETELNAANTDTLSE